MLFSAGDLVSLRNRHWARGRQVLDDITRHGFQYRLDSVPYPRAAFTLKDRDIRCIDGRVVGGGVHLAGSGVYLGLDGAIRFAKSAAATGVTYHDDCGAVARHAEDEGLTAADVPRHGREVAQALADALDVPCRPADIEGTPGFHDESVIYYDGTGRLNPEGCRLLPRGFVISRAYLDFHPAYAVWEVELAISLALGGIGYGELFTPEAPLVVVVVADSAGEAGALREELSGVCPPHGGRVVVDQMVAPAPA